MSGFVPVEILQAMVPEGVGVPPSVLAVLFSGLVGMSIREMIDIFGDEDDGDGDDGEGMVDGGLMAEEGGDDDLGGLGGLDEGDDEFGDFGDDEFGEMEGGGGADTDELEHRLDELETEVGSLSSTVNTVRNENEQIAETVDDVEENVRKLLDIYEMVTRGVNPFADDIDAGGLGGDGESFGLFSDEGEDEEEDIDEDIANADAEGFFDEDLVEEDASPEGDVGDVMGDAGDVDGGGGGFEDDGGTFDDGALEDDFDDDFDDMGDNDMSESTTESSGDDEGGKSFAELKDEYESGDAEWADEVDGDDGDAAEAETGENDDQLEEDGDDLLEGESDDLLEEGDDLADDKLFDEVIEDDGMDGGEEPLEQADAVPEPEQSDTEETAAETETTGPDPAATDQGTTAEPDPSAAREEPSSSAAGGVEATTGETGEGGRPYLGTLPEGFAADLIVVEWLEYLVDEVGVRETARAIDYYETIDWIAEPVGDDLQDYLRGFEDREGEADGLTIDHHTQSLRYISQLDGDAGEAVALSKLGGRRGGGLDGLQR